jgi:plastocyanin
MRDLNGQHGHGFVVRRLLDPSLWAGTLVLAATLVTGCTPSPVPPAEQGVTEVSIQGIAFVPKEVTIKKGEKVRWTNHESVPIVHTTTSGDPSDANAGALWNSGDLSPSDSFVRQFDEVGQFEYYCMHHSSTAAMRHAMVIVEP